MMCSGVDWKGCAEIRGKMHWKVKRKSRSIKSLFCWWTCLSNCFTWNLSADLILRACAVGVMFAAAVQTTAAEG